GGAGGGVIDLCICVEELSRACGGVGVLYAVNALGTFPVLVGGTEEQKHRFLRPIAKGEKLISFGLSEKFAGSDAASLRATAVKDGDSYVLNGEKKWNTNGGAADIYTVYREQFGAPISSFQMIQAMLADMATKTEAARNLVYVAALAVDTAAPNVSKLSAMCKLFATDTAMEVTTDAVQIFGGYGYMR